MYCFSCPVGIHMLIGASIFRLDTALGYAERYGIPVQCDFYILGILFIVQKIRKSFEIFLLLLSRHSDTQHLYFSHTCTIQLHDVLENPPSKGNILLLSRVPVYFLLQKCNFKKYGNFIFRAIGGDFTKTRRHNCVSIVRIGLFLCEKCFYRKAKPSPFHRPHADFAYFGNYSYLSITRGQSRFDFRTI